MSDAELTFTMNFESEMAENGDTVPLCVCVCVFVCVIQEGRQVARNVDVLIAIALGAVYKYVPDV